MVVPLTSIADEVKRECSRLGIKAVVGSQVISVKSNTTHHLVVELLLKLNIPCSSSLPNSWLRCRSSRSSSFVQWNFLLRGRYVHKNCTNFIHFSGQFRSHMIAGERYPPWLQPFLTWDPTHHLHRWMPGLKYIQEKWTKNPWDSSPEHSPIRVSD